MSFIYRDEDHTYWLDGQRIPALHDILTDAGFCPNLQFYTEKSASRGRTVHLGTRYLDEGICLEDALTEIFVDFEWSDRDLEKINNNVLSYMAFKEKYPGFRWFMIEEPTVNEVLRYGTTKDREGLDPEDMPCVLDIKTGAQEPWHKVQLAGQDFSRQCRRYILYLSNKPDKFKLVLCEDNDDYLAWEKAAWLYHYKRAKL